MTECNSEFDDNPDLHIADYYKYFPREDNAVGGEIVDTSSTDEPDTDRRGWI